MKRIFLTSMILLSSLLVFSQTDTTTRQGSDTVKVGNFVIIRNNKEKNTNDDSLPPKRDNYTIININRNHDNETHNKGRRKTVSTNYLIFDLGFANYNDKTDYSAPNSFLHYNAATQEPFTKNDFKLTTGKSSNVNLWLFMQKLNIAAGVFNLKYGLGLEMFNYRYKTNISYYENPSYIFKDSIDFSKNKLFVSYATIPFMINIDPSPNHRNGFSLSAGVEAGYRIGSHTKQESDERGKEKNHGDFNLAPWHFAYVAELGLGPVHLYGTYSINNLWQDGGLTQYPYTVGLRFSNW